MTTFVQPRIVISKCIEHDHCRYNSQIIRNLFVTQLKNHIEFIPICPEVEIGLGIPRNPIRIIQKQYTKHLIQPATKKDFTTEMKKFCDTFLTPLQDIDGFILKAKSPSCGINDVKIYPHLEPSAPIKRSSGFFGEAVQTYLPDIPIEDELRLENPAIREHFLRTIFCQAEFQTIKKQYTLKKLITFHTNNKFLFMSYSQKQLHILGNLIANQKQLKQENLLSTYQTHLYKLFKRPSTCSSNINILQHTYGYISKKLSKEEKQFFSKTINDFKMKKIPLSVLITLMNSWIIRFNEPYLKSQTYFHPYPDELLDLTSGPGCPTRNYWK